VRLRGALATVGLAHDTGVRAPVGRPDVVLGAARVAVFVDGCFWHGCPVHYVRPRSRGEFWAEKLVENVTRDRRQTLALEAAGWRVVRAWEHDVFEHLELVVGRVRVAARGPSLTEDELRVVLVEGIDEARNVERRHLERLREAGVVEIVEGRRFTGKWRRSEVHSDDSEQG
jgi:DNA mismatch endonuclease (patch repair protein)